VVHRDGPAINNPLDFFVSYAEADYGWAVWIAHELESAGYRVMIQKWDFVPGTNFMELIDRGISGPTVVVCVLSQRYMDARFTKMEWQAAFRMNPQHPETKVITVRVAECRLEGLLANLTFVDLLGIADDEQARLLLFERVNEALVGRAKPDTPPRFPNADPPPDPPVVRARTAPARIRRAPAYPAASPTGRSAVSVLHVSGPRFSVDDPETAGAALQEQLVAELDGLVDGGGPDPDLVVVTGDLTAHARPPEFDRAADFLLGLREALGLDRDRLVVVPSATDVSLAACRAYFDNCEADDIRPRAPYWPKWRHFDGRVFEALYRDLEGVTFTSEQPWTLHTIPDLRVVVAGLNPTVALSHLDDQAQLGDEQLRWFAHRLRGYERSGWLRIGALSRFDRTGPGRLADLDRLEPLSRRLNVLLHGSADPAPDPVGPTVFGPAGFDAAAPSQFQLLTLTAMETTRRVPGAKEPVRTANRLASASAAFAHPEAGDRASDPAADPADGEVRAVQSPMQLLLSRIAQVCEVRFEGSRIRWTQADPPYLVVGYQDDDVVREKCIAAQVGEVTQERVDAFREQLYAGSYELPGELVHQGSRPGVELREQAMVAGVHLRSLTEFQGLLDLSAYVDVQAQRLSEDRNYPPELYVPQRFRELDRRDRPVREGLVAELVRLLSSDQGRFVLLLGDFGRGKTFALRQLARQLAEVSSNPIPILIDMRELDKAHSVDGLVAAHLANHGEDSIDLRAFRYMLSHGRIVLLFDGFDELSMRVSYDRAADHLATLLAAATDQAKIVVSSRTQHFESTAQVLNVLGERVGLAPNRRILSVEDFDPGQIRQYLVNHFGGDRGAAESRLDLIGRIEDLATLSRNPRLLSFAADLDERRLEAVARAGWTLSAATLYREIISRWLTFEEQRTQDTTGVPIGLRREDMWRAVTRLALRMWETGESVVPLAEIVEIAAALTGLTEGRLTAPQTTHAIGAGSLLVRTDEAQFGFIHGSVGEWLVANEIATQLEVGVTALLSRRALTQLGVDFLCDIADTHLARSWAEGVLADRTSDQVARVNAMSISRRVAVPTTSDLRGVSLVGEDLSYRNLREVDASRADLSDAQLIGCDLARATLVDARLTGARLDDAVLRDADLTGADLSRARLAGADLRGVTVTGGRWARAALIGVQADPGLVERPELRMASVWPGMPVEPQLAPASVGVSYGFHNRYGRLALNIAYSPDGTTLVIGGDNGILICDAPTGQPVRNLLGHLGRVYAVTYGVDDTTLVSGASDGSLRVWDLPSGRTRHVLRGHEEWVWPLSASSRLPLAVSSDSSGAVRLTDTTTGAQRVLGPAHRGPVYSAVFQPGGTVLATAGSEGSVRLWDTTTAELRHDLPSGAGEVYRLVFSPGGDLLAGADETGTIRLWDVGTGAERRRLVGHARAVYTLDFHPDGRLLATADTGGTVRIWDIDSGAEVGVLHGHPAAVYRVVFSPNGLLLATCDANGGVRLWTVGTEPETVVTPDHELLGHRSAVWQCVFRPDGKQLATSSSDGTTRLWDITTGRSRQILRGHGRRVTSVSFDSDGTRIAARSNDGAVRLWEARTGEPSGGPLRGAGAQLNSALFSPADATLATASNDGRVHLWESGATEAEQAFDVETPSIWAEAFSADGRRLATANDDDTVRVWDRRTGAHLLTLREHNGRVRSIAFAPDGATILTGCDDSRVRLYDAEEGVRIRQWHAHRDRVYAVAFAPDGTRFATSGWDGAVGLWRTDQEEPVHLLAGHVGRVWTAAFQPTGGLVATAGDDMVVRLWDPTAGELVAELAGHAGRVYTLAFSPDGTRLASGGDDGAVNIWEVGTGASARLRLTLLGLPDGWAALTPDGAYKMGGECRGAFWFAIGLSRFEPGELRTRLSPDVRQLDPGAPF
jgi:WD40 repeat protein